MEEEEEVEEKEEEGGAEDRSKAMSYLQRESLDSALIASWQQQETPPRCCLSKVCISHAVKERSKWATQRRKVCYKCVRACYKEGLHSGLSCARPSGGRGPWAVFQTTRPAKSRPHVMRPRKKRWRPCLRVRGRLGVLCFEVCVLLGGDKASWRARGARHFVTDRPTDRRTDK